MFDFQCLSWTWYLACDMQLFIFSPLVICLLYKYVPTKLLAIYSHRTM